MKKKTDRLIVKADATMREVMEKITRSGTLGLPSGMVAVVDGGMRLLGVVTDGDMRRALVKGADLSTKVNDFMNTRPVVFSSELSYEDILQDISRRYGSPGQKVIEKIIIVDRKGRLEDIFDFSYLWQFQNVKKSTVAVIGLGLVGLPLAMIAAEMGFATYGIEKDKRILSQLNRGVPHFYEKGLGNLLSNHMKSGMFKTYEDLGKVKADIYVICVGTAVSGKNKRPDLAALLRACDIVSHKLKHGDLVILRSTVPVRATRTAALPVLEKGSKLAAGKDFFLVFAPERTTEGNVLEEVQSLPQVIGGVDERSLERAVNFFRYLCNNIVTVDSLEEAELVKLINNCYRDFNYSFANELTLFCDTLNINTARCIEAASKGYPRGSIPMPSPGVGGTSLTNDPYIYADSFKEFRSQGMLALSARRVNELMPVYLARKIIARIREMKNNAKVKVFVIGFAYKGFPQTSDTRDSTTIKLISALQAKDTSIVGYDPMVKRLEIEKCGAVPVSLSEGFRNADAVIFMNNNPSYAELNILRYLKTMRTPALFCDFWNIFSPDEITSVGNFTYMGLGFVKNPGA